MTSAGTAAGYFNGLLDEARSGDYVRKPQVEIQDR